MSRDGMADEIRKLGADLGYHVAHVYIDDGLSGSIRNRPEFLAWLDDCIKGRAVAAITWHADRLTREGVNAAAMILDVVEGKDSTTGAVVRPPVRLLDTKGCDSNDGSSFRWKFLIAAEVAREERMRIVDRNLSTAARLRNEKRLRGGPVPYGYQKVRHPSGKGWALDIDPDEARVVRLIIERVLGGESVYSTTQWLNENYPFPWKRKGGRDARWSAPVVHRLLTTGIYRGWYFVGGEPLRDEDGMPEQVWPEIMTRSEHQQILARYSALPRNSKGQGFRPRRTRLLSGVLHCSSCGNPVHSASKGRYQCTAVWDGRGCPKGVSINAEGAEAYVERKVLRTVGDWPYVKTVVTVRENVSLAEVDAELQTVAKKMALPGADVPTLAGQIGALQAKRKQLADLPVEPVTEKIDTGHSIAEEYRSRSTTAAQRELLLEVLVQKIMLLPRAAGQTTYEDRLTIVWRDDLQAWIDMQRLGTRGPTSKAVQSRL